MNIKATIIEHAQGSEAWIQHRSKSLNASELAAVMGLSSYTSRAELVRQKATGIAPGVHAATQRRFDKGHEFEAIARDWAEEIIGESLYPCVLAAEVDGLHLSASLDGQDLIGSVTWEHKTGRADLLASLERGVIPDEYHPQMEMGLMLSGAAKCLFMASSGDRDAMRFAWYEANPELRAKIIPTWKQFAADLAEFVPTTVEVKPIGKTPETLPALHIVIQGGVSASNLEEFKATALGAIQSVNRELTTDVHFADAEKAVKWCADIEDRIKAAKEHALGQTASIDALFRTMDDISAEARRVRLDLDKLVKARKESIKADIVSGALSALTQHLSELNAAMPADYMPRVPADFAGAIKGLRTVESIQNAAATELARAKIEAGQIATRIHANLKTIEAAGLVAGDVATLVLKAPDDLAAVIAQRLAAEKAKEEAQRERIRAEEVARLERARAAEIEAERKVREAAGAMALQRAQEEAGRLERAHTANTDAALEQHSLTLGEISDLLGIKVTQEVLARLGQHPFTTIKAARLYRVSQFPAICDGLIRQIEIAKHQKSPTRQPEEGCPLC